MVALVALGGEVQSAPSENRASLHHPRSWRMLHDAPRTTLIVCPVTILDQWRRELREWGGESLVVHTYYGPQRDKRGDQTMAGSHVVLTTFEILSRDVGKLPTPDAAQSAFKVREFEANLTEAIEFEQAIQSMVPGVMDPDEFESVLLQARYQRRRAEAQLRRASLAMDQLRTAFGASPLLRIRFNRLVVDEAHRTHDSSTRLSVALEAVEARSRWALTATPLATTGDTGTHGLCHFLRMDPYRHESNWFFHGRGAWTGREPDRSATLRLWLPVMWRQCKDAHLRASIPEKTERVLRLTLSPEEREVYDRSASGAREVLRSLQTRGALRRRQMRLGGPTQRTAGHGGTRIV